MSTRLGEYNRAIQRGDSPRHAAYSAREVSTDFAMRGDSQAIGFMYDTIMFLKAGVNGMDRLYRGLAHDPNRVQIAAKIALMATASMALYGLNRGNPAYEQLEDWDKDANWHFFIPKQNVDANARPEDRYWHFRYPKIWEIGAVASIAERTMGAMLDDPSSRSLGAHFLEILGNVENLGVIPQAVRPLYELATNRNLFTRRPIETQAMQDLQPWARFGINTPDVLRQLGYAERNLPRELQVSPAQIEALLRGYFNTWAMYAFTAIDAVSLDDNPDMRVDQYPVLRRFYSASPARGTHYLTELYDALREATEVRRTSRMMARQDERGIAMELARTPENFQYGPLTHASQFLRTLHGLTGLIQGADSLPKARVLAEGTVFRNNPMMLDRLKRSSEWDDIGALKRAMLDEITRQRNDFAKMVMTNPVITGRPAP